jgi:hypothetical protein
MLDPGGKLAFSDDEMAPAEGVETGEFSLVTVDVAGDLGRPVIRVEQTTLSDVA